MKLIDRYLVREFIPPLFLAWAILTGILVLQRLFLLIDLIVNKNLPVLLVSQILFTSLPFVISYTLPMAVMIASVMVFGRLAQDNELTALRAGGTSLVRIFVPVAAVGAVLSVLMVLFDSFVLPEANHKSRDLLTDVSKKRPAVRLREATFSDDFEGYTIYIGRIDDRTQRIYNVALYERKGSTAPTIITAAQGIMRSTPDEKYLTVTLFGGEIHELVGENYRQLKFDRQTINLPLQDELSRTASSYRSDREMPLGALWAKLDSMNADLRRLKKEGTGLRAKMRADSLAGQRASLAAGHLRLKENALRITSQRRNMTRYAVEVHKKFSLPLAGILFVFFGAPLGALLRRGGLGAGFLAGLLFFTFYYVLLLVGEELADSGRISAVWAMWLPSILMFAPATELFARVFFERSLLARR